MRGFPQRRSLIKEQMGTLGEKVRKLVLSTGFQREFQ